MAIRMAAAKEEMFDNVVMSNDSSYEFKSTHGLELFGVMQIVKNDKHAIE